MTFPDQAPRIQLTEADSSALTLDSYIMHVKSQLCRHCDGGAEWGELYEVWTHPTKTRSSALHVLRSASIIRDGMSVAYIKLPTASVPVCSECISTYRAPMLDTPSIEAPTRAAWNETLRRKYAPEPASAKTKAEPSLDSL